METFGHGQWRGPETPPQRGPPALTEGLPTGTGMETFGHGQWRGPETPPQRGPPALTEGLPTGTGMETFGHGQWRGPETPPQRCTTMARACLQLAAKRSRLRRAILCASRPVRSL